MRHSPSHRNGFSLVEVVVATSVILIFLTALIGAYNTYLNLSLSSLRKVKATFLAEETIEAVKVLRDTSWETSLEPLDVDTPYRLYWTGTSWAATTTVTLIDNLYDRTFSLSEVSRNGSGDIVSSGGTVDPDTYEVEVSVAWSEKGATTTQSIATYVANMFTP